MKVLIVLFTLCFLTISCRSPDPNPELKDPIYQDLQKKVGIFEKEHSSLLKEREVLQNMLDMMDINSGDYKTNLKLYYENEKAIERAKQQSMYAKIKLDERLREAKLTYLEYYKKEKENDWPPKEEFELYKIRSENNPFLQLQE